MIMKADKNMATFEEVLPAYIYTGHLMHQKYPQFETWELINEAFLKRSHEKAPCSKNLIQRIKWDMLDYILDTNGRLNQAKRLYLSSLVQTNMSLFDSRNIKSVHEQIVEKAELNRIMKSAMLSTKEKELIYLRFYRGLTLLEIADMKHVVESAISHQLKKLISYLSEFV